MRHLIAALLLLTLSSGCSTTGRVSGSRYSSRHLTYQVGDLPVGWMPARAAAADMAFLHRDRGATIYVDNSCRRYRDASLNVLANHLFFGFEDVEVLRQDIRAVDDREALVRVAEARLDGVLVRLGIAVLKRDNCIFDAVMIAPKDSFEPAFVDFESMLDGFHVERCP